MVSFSWLAGPSPGLSHGREGHRSLPRSREQTPLHPLYRVHGSDVIYLEPLPLPAVAGRRVDVPQPDAAGHTWRASAEAGGETG